MPLPRLKILIPAALLFLAAVVLVLVLFRIPICEWALPRLLQASGVSGLSLDLDTMGWSESRINSITCTLPHSSNLSLAANNITADYTPEELIHGRLRALAIGGLDLTLGDTSTAGGKGFNPRNFSDLMSEDWPARIPVKRLTIDRLLLHGSSAWPVADLPIRLELATKPGTLLRALAGVTLDQVPLTVRLNIDRSREYRFALAAEGSAPAVSGSLQSRGGTVTGSQHVWLTELARLSQLVARPLPSIQGDLEFNFIADLGSYDLGLNGSLKSFRLDSLSVGEIVFHIKARTSLDPPALRLDSPSEIRLSSLDGTALHIDKVHLPLHGRAQRDDRGWQIASLAETPWEAAGIDVGSVRLEQCSLLPVLTLDLGQDKATARLGQDLRLTITGLEAANLSLPEIAITPARPDQELVLVMDGSKSRHRIRTGRLRLAPIELKGPGGIGVETGELTLDPGTLDLAGSHWSLPLTAQTGSASVRTDRIEIPLGPAKLEAALDQNLVRGTAQLVPATVPGALQVNFRHRLAEGKGEASVISAQALDLGSDTLTLGDLITVPDFPATLDEGIINLSASAAWRKGTAPVMEARLQLTDGAGTLQDNRFTGLALDQHLKIKPELSSISPGTISIRQVDTGVVLEDIRLVTDIQPSAVGPRPQVFLSGISASVLGGTVGIEQLVYDLNLPKTDATVLLSQISLQRINAISQVKGLHVSGRIDGVLPMRLEGRRILIEQGELISSGSGTIRYLPPQDMGQQSSPLTQYALKALEEFHYDLFKAEVSYRPDGSLIANLHFQGRSPGLETDRPVHLNINTEQNLLSLLRSLQYSRGVTTELDQQLERKYQQPAEPDR